MVKGLTTSFASDVVDALVVLAYFLRHGGEMTIFWMAVVLVAMIGLVTLYSWLLNRIITKRCLARAKRRLRQWGVGVVDAYPNACPEHEDDIVVVFTKGNHYGVAFCARCGTALTAAKYAPNFWEEFRVRLRLELGEEFRVRNEELALREVLGVIEDNAALWRKIPSARAHKAA